MQDPKPLGPDEMREFWRRYNLARATSPVSLAAIVLLFFVLPPSGHLLGWPLVLVGMGLLHFGLGVRARWCPACGQSVFAPPKPNEDSGDPVFVNPPPERCASCGVLLTERGPEAIAAPARPGWVRRFHAVAFGVYQGAVVFMVVALLGGWVAGQAGVAWAEEAGCRAVMFVVCGCLVLGGLQLCVWAWSQSRPRPADAVGRIPLDIELAAWALLGGVCIVLGLQNALTFANRWW
jgi:hypothetical protein